MESCAAESPCLVGVIDQAIDDISYASWDVNKIGGKPDWMKSGTPHPQCNCCRRLLTLVTQLYCPLEASVYHRTIYVFTCLSGACQQDALSFRVFRAQLIAVSESSKTACPSSQEAVADPATFSTDWCDDADDWGDEPDDLTAEGSSDDVMSCLGGSQNMSGSSSYADAARQVSESIPGLISGSQPSHQNNATPDDLEASLQQLKLESNGPYSNAQLPNTCLSPSHHWRLNSDQNNVEDTLQFQSYFINVFEESQELMDGVTSHELQLMKEYQQREGVCLAEWEESAHDIVIAEGGKGKECEGYEKATAKHGDRIFQKFIKRIQSCPQQCIRYNFQGSPLWLTAPAQGQTSVSLCQYCGKQRQYEFQLMPALLPHLQLTGNQVPPIDFGVVVVYTCSQSCWTDESTEFLREEALIVQGDPDTSAISTVEKQLGLQ